MPSVAIRFMGILCPSLKALARANMVRKLRQYVNDKYPGMSFGIEHVSDITAHYSDYIHTVNGGAAVSNPNWAATGQKPRVPRNMDWFRYIFPEVIISNREIRDDSDVERRVNRLVLTNLISDVEVYRCKKTIAETPHYQRYLGLANAFRVRNARFLKGARFRSTILHHCDNDESDSAGCIARDGSIVIMATQSHSTTPPRASLSPTPHSSPATVLRCHLQQRW